MTPRNCNVSTMTVCGKINTSLDVESVWNSLEAACAPYGLDIPCESPKKKTKTFYNQLTVKSNNTSIKLFSNGSVQVTGVKSPVHFADVMDRVCSALGSLLGDSPSLESASISLINAVFSASVKLPLRVLRQALEDAGHSASYDPDAYPGINAKIHVDPNFITVMIFTSGTVIISGAKTPEHVSSVYHTVCTIIDSLDFEMNESPPAHCSLGTLAMYSILNGYSSRIAHLCLDG
jgi:TATA-box binding protein (TBP) (component of TFIID and TFIIIB)